MGQRIIGLTGGIATGKTTVSHYLKTHHGLPILDADVFARQAVEPGIPILTAIAQRYGATVLNADGTLHRQQLGQIIFNDPQEKQWVEQQIHPFVRQRFAQEMAKLAASPTVVQAIPLLFEANLTDQVTEIWVVTCPETTQLARLMARNALSQEAAQARMGNQWPLAEKTQRADRVLDNSSSLESLYQQVDHMLGK
ncbi:MAG: dephospho-CoA kinase [Leptolyngbyaceae cyanobacterium]